MITAFRAMLVATVFAAPTFASAQTQKVSDYEGHFVRGLIERQGEAISMSQLALTRSTTPAVTVLAHEILTDEAEGQNSLRAVGNKYNAVTPGGPRGPGASGGPPRRSGGQDGPRGGGGGPAGGVIQKLQNANATNFDNLYLLDVVLLLEEYERSIDLESATATATPDLVAWCRDHLEIYRKQARMAQKAVRGDGPSADNPLERERGTADLPPKI